MEEAKTTTSPLGSTRVVKSTTSPLGSAHVVYDVWVMTGLKDNRRIASKASLHEAHAVVTPEHRKEYVYILKWTPATEAATHEVSTFGPSGRFGALQGQRPDPQSASSLLRSRQAVYIWGCLCNRAHTNDLRESVRKVLRSNL